MRKCVALTMLFLSFLLSSCTSTITYREFEKMPPEKKKDKVLAFVNEGFSEVSSDFNNEKFKLNTEIIDNVRHSTITRQEQVITGHDINSSPTYGDITRHDDLTTPLSVKEREDDERRIEKLTQYLNILPKMKQDYLNKAEKDVALMNSQQLFDLYSPENFRRRIKEEVQKN